MNGGRGRLEPSTHRLAPGPFVLAQHEFTISRRGTPDWANARGIYDGQHVGAVELHCCQNDRPFNYMPVASGGSHGS